MMMIDIFSIPIAAKNRSNFKCQN